MAGRTVKTSSATVFDDNSCALIRNSVRVEVKGTRAADGTFTALRVEIEDQEIEGTVSGLTGTCPALTFTLAGLYGEDDRRHGIQGHHVHGYGEQPACRGEGFDRDRWYVYGHSRGTRRLTQLRTNLPLGVAPDEKYAFDRYPGSRRRAEGWSPKWSASLRSRRRTAIGGCWSSRPASR